MPRDAQTAGSLACTRTVTRTGDGGGFRRPELARLRGRALLSPSLPSPPPPLPATTTACHHPRRYGCVTVTVTLSATVHMLGGVPECAAVDRGGTGGAP